MFEKVTRPRVTHLKAGFYGLDGSGKTRTATELAIALHRHTKSTKGILFIDTENGSDFMAPLFEAAGIDFYQDKTRTFATLMADLEAAVKVADIVLIDSVTHFWRELLAAYQESKGKKFIDLSDWDPIKREWRRFTDLFLTAPLHIIICGRLGNVFEDVWDEERDKHSTVKTGSRMAGEGETGYEPHLVCELAKAYRRKGGTFDVRCTVTKDRWDRIHAKQFTFKTGAKSGEIGKAVFDAFRPHVDCYAFGAEAPTVDVSSSSAEMFAPTGPSYSALQRRRSIELEEIDGLFTRYMPGSTAKERQLRTEIRVAVFGTSSDTKISSLMPERLLRGKRLVHALLVRVAAGALTDAPQYLPQLQALATEIEAEPDEPDFAEAPTPSAVELERIVDDPLEAMRA